MLDLAVFDARVTADGRATLGPSALAVRSDLDRRFAEWGVSLGAAPTAYPTVLSTDELVPLDYFANFPHLASVVGGLRTGPPPAGAPDLSPANLTEPGHALPSAACYSAYLSLTGTTVDRVMVTTAANCFRREDHYDGLRRLFGFTMREVVCVGPREVVLDFLSTGKARVRAFFDALGLPYEVAAATDPFFDPDGARTLMQKLFPVKEEFLFGGDLAIASVNFHRNFFGERCAIRLPSGEPAFTGCVAFGLERWLAALGAHFGSADAALAALADAGKELT
jgi:hypothetical protein